MVKDLLHELKQIHSQQENDSPVAPNAVVITMPEEKCMQEFFDQVEDIRSTIETIQRTVDEVKTQQSTILSEPKQDNKMKERLDELMDEIKRNGNKVRLKLKAMEQSIEQEEANNMSTANLRIKKTQRAALHKRFVGAMLDYSNVQVRHQERYKKLFLLQLEIAEKPVTMDQLDDMIESGNLAIFTQGIMTDTQQAKQNLADIEARHQEIVKLERSIKELHDMFLDMSMLVGEQGEMIDRIEYNVQHTVDFVEIAKVETKKATVYQSKARKTKIIIIAIVVVVVVIIVASLIGGLVPKK